jgi:hypothetical protein
MHASDCAVIETGKNHPGRKRWQTGKRLNRVAAWRMLRRRAKAAGISAAIGNHTTRGTIVRRINAVSFAERKTAIKKPLEA